MGLGIKRYLCSANHREDLICRTKLIKLCEEMQKEPDARFTAAATHIIKFAQTCKNNGKQLDCWDFHIILRNYFRRYCIKNHCSDSYESEYFGLIIQIENRVWPCCQKR